MCLLCVIFYLMKDFQFENCVKRYTQNFPFFLSFPLFSQEKKVILPFLHTIIMLIIKDKLSIQQKDSFIEDVRY